MNLILRITTVLYIFILFPTLTNGQDITLEPNLLTSGFHISVIGTSGFTKFGFEPNAAISLRSPLLTQNSFSVDLQYYFKERYFFSSSIGVLVTTHKNYKKANGMDWYHYRDGLTWLEYGKVNFGIGYIKVLNRNILKAEFKAGGLKRRNYLLTRGEEGFSRVSRIRTNSKIHPFVNLKFSYGIILNNYDLVELGAHYRHSFSDIYSGDYLGLTEFYGRGKELGINLSYTFTNYTRRLAKRKSKRDFLAYKKSRRKLGDKDRLIEISSELFSYLNINKDPEGIIVNSYSNLYAFRAKVEFGITEKKFIETGLHFGSYDTGYTTLSENKANRFSKRSSGPNYQTTISFGLGCRFQTKKKINILTLSGGISINGSASGSAGSSSITRNSDNFIFSMIEWEDEDKTFIYPTIYANLNKDFQISKRMYLSLNFRYNLGLIKNSVRTYTAITYNSKERTFSGSRNGTSRAVGLGLKYNLGSGNKKHSSQQN